MRLRTLANRRTAQKGKSMSLLCQPERSILLLLDLQERLLPAIHDSAGVVARCVQLATAAREMHVHVIGTEQNPDGLGPAVAEIRALCETRLTKFHFSAAAEP